ncbi:hypothetical protein [Niabella aquatica]
MSVGYQRVMASPGDFGIEGYTKDGHAFQCFCPEINEENKKLYERQRQKITDDINKLKTNQKELLEIFGGTKLKCWILITPRMGHHDLLTHCNTKRDLVKSWDLPFIDNATFQILVHECDDYAPEIGEYFDQTGKKLAITPNLEDSNDEKIIQWKDTKIDLVQKALEKNEIRIRSSGKNENIDKHTNALTDETARLYLNGESILRIWRSTQPDNHQRFIELLASVEDELKERCILRVIQPNLFVNEVRDYIENRIRAAFPHLDESTIIRLKNYCISFWIITCPLYFELTADAN